MQLVELEREALERKLNAAMEQQERRHRELAEQVRVVIQASVQRIYPQSRNAVSTAREELQRTEIALQDVRKELKKVRLSHYVWDTDLAILCRNAIATGS